MLHNVPSKTIINACSYHFMSIPFYSYDASCKKYRGRELSCFNFPLKKEKKKKTKVTYGANGLIHRHVVFNKISGKTPWCSPIGNSNYSVQAARQNEQNWHVDHDSETERDGSSPGEERWPISRYSAHMPRPTIQRSCAAVRCIASLHRAALLVRFDGITFINAHDSPVGLPRWAVSCELPFVRSLFDENCCENNVQTVFVRYGEPNNFC